MPDSPEPQSLIDSAERAAKAGDYATAERLLREAADLQESGPPAQRADLANTLNNLGIVCELTDNPVEAERCFRRAYQIAVEVLEPGHPFLTTSRKNLEDFCRANGKELFPFGEPQPKLNTPPTPAHELVTAPQLTDLLRDLAPPPPPAPPPQPRVTVRDAAPTPPPPVEPALATPSRAAVIALVVVALLFAVFLARSLFLREPPTRDAASVAPSQEPATPAVPTPAPAPQAAQTPPPAPVERAPVPAPKETVSAKRTPTPTSRPASKSAATASIALVNGELCRNLRTGAGEWRCEPAGDSVKPGQLFFYTRVKSARDAVVEHRWYRGNELRKSADLNIAANPGAGYRTFSRNTVNAGEWRVELRMKSGEVLLEKRFSVR